jgi:hypothetical protein
MLGRMALRASLGVLRERDFRLLLTGQTLSNLGSALLFVPLGCAVVGLVATRIGVGTTLIVRSTSTAM